MGEKLESFERRNLPQPSPLVAQDLVSRAIFPLERHSNQARKKIKNEKITEQRERNIQLKEKQTNKCIHYLSVLMGHGPCTCENVILNGHLGNKQRLNVIKAKEKTSRFDNIEPSGMV